MNNKNLSITSGIVGLVGGILLLFGLWLSSIIIILDLLKAALLVLGILGIIYLRDNKNVSTTAPSILLIIGGAISFIPFLGWIGGILGIIGGSLYISKIKKMN